MANPGTEFGLKLMRVIGAQKGVTYLSTPISTGYRDLALMREKGCGKEELRERYPREYRERVIAPNEREAHKYAQMVRNLGGEKLVLNPGELYVPEWTQRDYWAFWEEAIRSFALEVAVTPGWVFSAGARFEVITSLQTMVRLIDVRGTELSPRDLQALDGRARAQLLREGYTQDEIEAYMPWLDFGQASSDTSDLSDNIRAFSDIAERHNGESRQRKTGSDQQ